MYLEGYIVGGWYFSLLSEDEIKSGETYENWYFEERYKNKVKIYGVYQKITELVGEAKSQFVFSFLRETES